MKKLISIICISLVISCAKETNTDNGASVSSDEAVMLLSHAPVTDTCTGNGDAKIRIRFDYDEYIAGFILSEYGAPPIAGVRTRGELVDFYIERLPNFEPGWSNFFSTCCDNNHVFAKCEYLLAQECFQDNCSSRTRILVLQTAVAKQKEKHKEYVNSFAACRTGVFLISLILVKENDAAFINALKTNADLQNALSLDQHIRIDDEFGNLLMQFAENYLAEIKQ